MEVWKVFWEFWLVGWTFILFILFVIYLFYKWANFIPIAINKHFEELKAIREDYSKNLKDITEKFGKQLDTMNLSTQHFFEQVENEHKKNYTKLEAIHSDVKYLKSNK